MNCLDAERDNNKIKNKEDNNKRLFNYNDSNKQKKNPKNNKNKWKRRKNPMEKRNPKHNNNLNDSWKNNMNTFLFILRQGFHQTNTNYPYIFEMFADDVELLAAIVQNQYFTFTSNKLNDEKPKKPKQTLII